MCWLNPSSVQILFGSIEDYLVLYLICTEGNAKKQQTKPVGSSKSKASENSDHRVGDKRSRIATC